MPDPDDMQPGRPASTAAHRTGVDEDLADDPRAPQPQARLRRTSGRHWARRLALAQGAFYLVSGVWPLLHLRSFLAVTGPKTDLWLVQTVGALLAVIGGGLLLSARRRVGVDWHWVGGGSALVLALVDVIFVGRQVIPPIYLADAAAEAALVLAWGIVGWCELAEENS